MSEETLWARAYGDEYWADVTSPLFFSLVGEYLTEYVNHEGARIMGYREIADNCVWVSWCERQDLNRRL